MFHVRNILNSIRKKKRPYLEQIQKRRSIPLRFLCTENLKIEKISDEGNTEDLITFPALALLDFFGLVFMFGFWGFCASEFLPVQKSTFRGVNNPIITSALAMNLLKAFQAFLKSQTQANALWVALKSIWIISPEEPNPPIFPFVASLIWVLSRICAQ